MQLYFTCYEGGKFFEWPWFMHPPEFNMLNWIETQEHMSFHRVNISGYFVHSLAWFDPEDKNLQTMLMRWDCINGWTE